MPEQQKSYMIVFLDSIGLNSIVLISCMSFQLINFYQFFFLLFVVIWITYINAIIIQLFPLCLFTLTHLHVGVCLWKLNRLGLYLWYSKQKWTAIIFQNILCIKSSIAIGSSNYTFRNKHKWILSVNVDKLIWFLQN